MKDFESWYTELISDTLWYELLRHYKTETVKKSAEKVFAQLVADKTVGIRPMSENRKHVYNMTCKQPGDRQKVDWRQLENKITEELKEEEWKPVTPEKRAEYLEKVQAIIKGSTMMTSVPRVSRMDQVAEAEGQWLPKKEAPYPSATPEEVYVRQRHLEYVKQNYEARTGAKLPGWIPEDEFNIQYDNDLL